MNAFAFSFLTMFLGSAVGAYFAMWCDDRKFVAGVSATLFDLNLRVTALELDAAAAGAQGATAALLKKLEQ